MFMLKVEKNEKGNEVFAKKRTSKGFIYPVKDLNDGQVFWVSKPWIIAGKNSIVNVGVSGDSIYPIQKNSMKCSYCGQIHRKSALTPVYGDNGKRTNQVVCKKCLEVLLPKGSLYQCIDCKRVFDVKDTHMWNYDDRNTDFHVCASYHGGSLCSDCKGKKYDICTSCDDATEALYGEGQFETIGLCVVKKSDMSKRYACPKECVQMFKDREDGSLKFLEY